MPSVEEVEDEGAVLCPACETEGEEEELNPNDIYQDKAIQVHNPCLVNSRGTK